MKRFVLFLLISIVVVFFLKKFFVDFAGDLAPNNQVCLTDISKTKYRTDILSKFIDTFLSKHPEYDATKHGYPIDTSLSFLSLRNIYFNSNPTEIYLIRVDYPVCIRTTYNFATGVTLAFHANEYEKELSTNIVEVERIRSRFQKEVLDTVIRYIEKSSFSDSIKYIDN